MRHKDCIFDCEEICPKEKVKLTCADCWLNQSHEMIKKAIDDYTGLGEAFTEIFDLHKKIIDGHGTTIDIKAPVDSVFVAIRVMTAILGAEEKTEFNDILYKRLIFYFFKILIDEVEETEYNKKETYLH